jgi:Cell division control protein 14, SIN component
MMLKKDVDYIPLSPKKPQATRSGVNGSSTRYISRTRLRSGSEDDCQQWSPALHASTVETQDVEENKKSSPGKEHVRTTEEKKELLGTMLGNVDALVEGVRKAGIWGLG